jgi:Arc/MetJ family transcription regulator
MEDRSLLTALQRDPLDIHINLSYCVYRSEVIQVGRTNIVLDDTLVADCQKATGLKTRRALIDHALQELLRHERQKKVLELKGTVQWEGNLATWRKRRG